MIYQNTTPATLLERVVARESIEKLIISPGPCTPERAGSSVELVKKLRKKVPILGVCLGHQCIAYAFGGVITRARIIMHGKTSRIKHDGSTLFKGIPNPFEATRYHSLVVDRKELPGCFDVTAVSLDGGKGEVMAIRHKEYDIFGVQFHPESILTKDGKKLIKNFLDL
jgi:anthranilate synthase/aminodeoxychorismate synthase-like glutamine amidotransferase